MVPPSLRTPNDEMPVAPVDRAMLDRLRRLDPDGSSGLLPEVVSQLLATVPDRLDALLSSIARNDLRAAEALAHGLQSACGAYGAFRMGAIAAEIESRARAGRRDGLEALADILGAEFVPVREVLADWA